MSLTTYVTIQIWLVLTVLWGVLAAQIGGPLSRYYTGAYALIMVHVVGDTAQDLDWGPEFMQGHLHNFGLPAVMTYGIAICTLFDPRVYRPGTTYVTFVRRVMDATPFACVLMTGVCVLIEVANATIYADDLRAAGYSGALDIVDISASVAGGIALLVNHYVWVAGARRQLTLL